MRDDNLPHSSSSAAEEAKVLWSKPVGGIEAFRRDFNTDDNTLIHSPTHSEYLSASDAEVQEVADASVLVSWPTRPAVQR